MGISRQSTAGSADRWPRRPRQGIAQVQRGLHDPPSLPLCEFCGSVTGIAGLSGWDDGNSTPRCPVSGGVAVAAGSRRRGEVESDRALSSVQPPMARTLALTLVRAHLDEMNSAAPAATGGGRSLAFLPAPFFGEPVARGVRASAWVYSMRHVNRSACSDTIMT